MKIILLAAILCQIQYLALAQSGPVKFGEVSMEELTMKSYRGDTSAAAVILFDKGSTVVTFGATVIVQYRRHVRIKIFDKKAFDKWANERLLVDRNGFSKLKGVTYSLEEGKIVTSEIDDNGVFRVRYSKYIDEIKFTLPNVKEGSVVEYSYVVNGDGVPGWQFQYSIPTIWSEYSLDVPPNVPVRKIMKGVLPVTSHEVKNRMEKWILKDIPAFKREPFMPNESDYVSSIDFSFSKSSWEGISKSLWSDEDFGGVITGSSFLKKQVEEITAGITDQKQKMLAIYKYVKKNVEWNGVEDLYADDLRNVFRNKKGTAADINLALASMLRKAGLPVEMVLLSTRGNGFLRVDFPSVRQFDYTICLAFADSMGYLLDATEKYLPWNALPQRCLNGLGFAVSDEGYRWVDVISDVKAKTAVNAQLTLNETGELKGKLTYTRDGYAASEMRNDFYKLGKDAYLEDFAKMKSWNMINSEFQDMEDVDRPSSEVHEISILEHVTAAGDNIYVDPFITFKEDENPFKEEKREFPIDFGVRSEKVYLTVITIPDGYVVDEAPKNKVMLLPENAGKFYYSFTQVANKLTVVSNIQINSRIFMQDQYPNLRELYSRIVAKQAEVIVLKRK